jgi:lactoylglutathione lyase
MASVLRVGHFGLTVRDIDASLAFWRDLLGLPELGRGVVEWEHLDAIVGLSGTRIDWAEVELPDGALLELFAYLRPAAAALPAGGINRPGMTHICLEVSDIEQLTQRLRAAGYQSRSTALVTIPHGAYRGFKCIYFLDPDGVTVELSQPPPGAGPPARHRASQSPGPSAQEAGRHD